jgi:multiple sugar transport system ATP-binding protein
MAEVRLVEVSRQYAQQTVVDRVSLTIPDGEFWVLVGGSGSGKSTILRSIAGLESVSSGQIYIGDRLVNDIPARDRDVAMVFQNYALYPHMSVAENLAFGLKMRKAPPDFIKSQVQKAAQMLNISHLLERKPPQLSGGQQQRVALGRAIVRQPQVFLLDEPLSNLDAQLRDETRAELKKLHQQVGITTIYVTHDQAEAMTLADKIVVLANGQIQQIGTPQEVYDRPANRLVATFLGNPPTNILPGVYQDGRWQVGSQWIELNQAYPQFKALDLGIRPEHLSLEPISLGERSAIAGANSLRLTVMLLEPLGRETLVKTQLIDTDLVVDLIAPAGWSRAIGSEISVYFQSRDLRIFNPHNGDVLGFVESP